MQVGAIGIQASCQSRRLPLCLRPVMVGLGLLALAFDPTLFLLERLLLRLLGLLSFAARFQRGLLRFQLDALLPQLL